MEVSTLAAVQVEDEEVSPDIEESGVGVLRTGSQESSSSSTRRASLNKDDETAGLSKKAAKRLAKKAKWEESKKLKRVKQRAKKKEQNQRRAGTEFSRKALKLKKMANSSCKIGVVIDLSFDEYMKEKDIAKTVKQVNRCYSINRRQPEPLQLHVTSFAGESAKVMEKHEGFSNWDLHFHSKAYDEIFDPSSMIYLTSDSENVIETLEPNKYYIIGGLVDHNSKKGLCHELAVKKGINHARLPIDDFIEMKTRKVFTINHVFEMIASVSQGKSWEESLITVIPQRKSAELKSAQPAEPEADDDDAEDPSCREQDSSGSD